MKLELVAAFFALGTAAVWAQGVVAYVEGDVFVEGQRVEAVPFQVKSTTVIRTEKGRAEVLLIQGGSLFLGENSSVRQRENRLALLVGSAVVITGDSGLVMDCEDSATLSEPGVYRFDYHPVAESIDNVCRFRVYRGAAAVKLSTTASVLTPGKTMGMNRHCGDMIPTNEFNTEQTDSLDNWSRQRVLLRRP